MTIQQLQCFAMVAKYRNFARAAEQLFVSQPAVSQHIQHLQQELGQCLVIRSKHSVTLTPEGAAFYIEVADILQHLERAADMLHAQSFYQETLHVGFELNIRIPHLSEIYRSFHMQNPQIAIQAHTADTGNERQMFQDGLLDVLFTCNANLINSGIGSLRLFGGRFYCVMPKGHPLSGRVKLNYTDIQQETLILLSSGQCPSIMDELQRKIRKTCAFAQFTYSSASELSFAMIEAGLGIAIMPQFVIPPQSNVSRVPFDAVKRLDCYMIWKKDAITQKKRRFIIAAKEFFPNSQTGD